MAQLFEGLPSLLQSRSQLLVGRFGCGFQILIGEYHAWGSSSLHQKNLSITLRYLLAGQFGRRAFWTPFGKPIGHSLLRQLHHGSVFVSCHLIMGLSNVERSLSLAQYGIRAEVCPSSWHDYHSVYMANDDQGCCIRPWWDLRIILSSDIYHEESAYHVRYSRSSE